MAPCSGDICIITGRSSQLERIIARAVALHGDGRLDEAATLYRDILKTTPDHTGVLHNLAVVLAQAGEPKQALELFDRAIAFEPAYVYAHVNRGGALQSLGRLAAAASAYGRALALQPDLYPVRLRRALVLLALGRRADALDHFRNTHAHRRRESMGDGNEKPALSSCRLKMAHDAAQFRHLAAAGVEVNRFTALADLYQEALHRIPWPADDSAPMDVPADWRDRLAESYDRPLHLATAAEVATAVNPALDVAAVVESFTAGAPAMAVIDDLLTPGALAGLRRYLLDSTIWYDFTHIGGFLAAYLEDGMACPLLLQIVAELRRRLPGLLGAHALCQAWAFKCLTGDRGIDVHADAGAISVNFWITPDGANLEPGSGGLVIHGAAPPAGWALADYHGDIGKIRQLLADSPARSVTVPYAENRAVLLRSDLFHESAAVKFRPGYENHRINITLLFGDQPRDL